MSNSNEVLKLLKKIPQGKVTTYGELARKAKTSPQAVGQIMRRNTQPETFPCYKVISSSGKVHGYAGKLSGKEHQKKIALLRKDGVKIENGKIDLQKFGYRF